MAQETHTASASSASGDRRVVCVFDRRFQGSKAKEERLETSGLDIKEFRRILSQTFPTQAQETFVLVNTERRVLDADAFERLVNGATLYMLREQDQSLEMPTEELINFTPHHDTVVESGTFKYYDSEGKKALPYALADLVDNSITATASNTGPRIIEIRMLFDENLGKPAVVVLDNGCGMTTKQLNNWAVYKLSKFKRDLQSDQPGHISPTHFPRSLNSDISYFGVGGKQAAFYIGKSIRMITKSHNSPDVHELVLSKSLFEKKEKNKEDAYSTTILNRRSGDFEHIKTSQEQFLKDLIAEECSKESFTAVVITEVLPEHVEFLKGEFAVWTKQLAHIYHYYIHGVNGNSPGPVPASQTKSGSKLMANIDILIYHKAKARGVVVDLRDVNTDMQSMYIKAAVSTFEFKAQASQGSGVVEGIIRYHPFLYDSETYPQDRDDEPEHVAEDEDDADCTNDVGAKKKRPIFECFWNGRLIPYTTLTEFDWCSQPKGGKVPAECYNRFSGVLFTNDTFKVTENKLTFIDLEQKLKNKETTFTRSLNGQNKGQRTNLQRDFTNWLQECHEQFDKQVKFMNYRGTITRTDITTKKRQHPWATFASVEWHGRVYKAGDYVKTIKTLPIHHGTVKRFLFFGKDDCGDTVFAPGGQVEITMEPKGLYDCTKIVQLSKLDRSATPADIQKGIEQDSLKLPHKLQVGWPNKDPWKDKSTRLATDVLGPINVYILNQKGEPISRISSGGPGRKLSVELELVYQSPSEEQPILLPYSAPHSAKFGFWFKGIDHFMELGKYTLYLKTVLAETKAPDFGGQRLPQFKLSFTIKAGKPEQFAVDLVNASFHIGVPFDIILQMKDIYGHPAEAMPDHTVSLLCSGFDVVYEKSKCDKTKLLIKNAKVTGKLKSLQPSPHDLVVTVEGLKEHSQTLKIHFLPGRPHSILVLPKNDPISVQNGDSVKFDVLVLDEAGNNTAHSKMTVQCLVPNHTPAAINCSSGTGTHVTKPICVSIEEGKPHDLKVKFLVPNQSSIKPVARALLVFPSKRAKRMELYKQDDEILLPINEDKIQWVAGGVLDNLFFKLFDEANREIALTDEVTSKIKVNWTSKIDSKELGKGKLPDVSVPTKVCEDHFYQVSYQEQNVSFSFTIVPIPDEPVGLKATVPKCTARLGESLREPIVLELIDQFDNLTKTLTLSCLDQIKAEGESLDESQLDFKYQSISCSVLVTGVCFLGGTPGDRVISFTFQSLTCRVKLSVMAGVPAKLKLISEPLAALLVLNENGITTPFVIQLCDKWGNPSPDQRVVVKMWPSRSELKVVANVSSQPVDAKGQALFSVERLSGPKGYYQLNFEGIFNKEPIAGPCINLTILPDPNKPVGLNVRYDTTVTFFAGQLFPAFSVTVVSDEGTPITRFNPSAVSMLCWKGVLSGKPPNSALEFQCSKPLEKDSKNSFYFREKPIPEDAGRYTIQFSLQESRKDLALYSEQIIVNVEATKPVKLAPHSPPPAQIVSYCQDLAKRMLLQNMTLMIVDQYGNPAGQRLNGDVEIRIKKPNAESAEALPLFEGKADCVKIKLKDGKAHIERLAVMENSPGEHGATYVVLFRAVLSPEPPEPLESYEFHFGFSNDVQNREKCVTLTREKDSIRAAIKKSTDQVNTQKGIIKEYNGLFQMWSENEKEKRSKLNEQNLQIPENATTAMVDEMIHMRSQQAQTINRRPRRTCNIPNDYRDIPDVLGRVGHLALVEDEAEAWVISWHLRGDINCVITITKEAALGIYRQTNGNQEVMPIDGINAHCRHPFQPLPHIVKHFPAAGNPVYAVDVLRFPKNKTECEIVFRNILSNTILIDDLDSANKYRQMVVRSNLSCPTILTREGQRITGRGKFGGGNNHAPPRDRVSMFGAPLSERYHALTKDIELLKEYKTALEKKNKSDEELTQICTETVPIIKQSEKYLEELNRKLEGTQRQLDALSQPGKRTYSSSIRTDVPIKRARSGSST